MMTLTLTFENFWQLEFERELKAWSEKVDVIRPFPGGGSVSPKWPRHASRQRELEALNSSLTRSKENSILGVSFS